MKPKQRSKLPKNQNNSLKKFGFVFAWFMAAALAAGGIFAVVRFIQEDNHVIKIAKQFKCICKMNCNLSIGNCSCREPGGATEVKGIIRSAIKRGLSDEDIASLLTSRGVMK